MKFVSLEADSIHKKFDDFERNSDIEHENHNRIFKPASLLDKFLQKSRKKKRLKSMTPIRQKSDDGYIFVYDHRFNQIPPNSMNLDFSERLKPVRSIKYDDLMHQKNHSMDKAESSLPLSSPYNDQLPIKQRKRTDVHESASKSFREEKVIKIDRRSNVERLMSDLNKVASKKQSRGHKQYLAHGSKDGSDVDYFIIPRHNNQRSLDITSNGKINSCYNESKFAENLLKKSKWISKSKITNRVYREKKPKYMNQDYSQNSITQSKKSIEIK